jgi:tetratricopeptide (TPR) repeat protein
MKRATAAFPDMFISNQYLERGMALLRNNQFTDALTNFDNAIYYLPDCKYAHWNRATALLSLGYYEEGFKEHDYAWQLFDWRGFGPIRDDIDRLKHLPIWVGDDISTQSFLAYHELGFGDGIQTLRYLPELKRRAGHVTLVISPELARLAEPFGVEVVTKLPDDISGYTYRLPLFGVMSALKQTLTNIPNAPYIHRTFPKTRENRIGICWSGRTQTAFTLDHFLSMFDHDEFNLYSLQLGEVDDRVAPLDAKDFADTADLIAALDHVITIDSALAHLAGAMGHPSTHLLLPFLSDWRWHHTEVWYPTIKTYRQPSAGDWATPFAHLNEAINP